MSVAEMYANETRLDRRRRSVVQLLRHLNQLEIDMEQPLTVWNVEGASTYSDPLMDDVLMKEKHGRCVATAGGTSS